MAVESRLVQRASTRLMDLVAQAGGYSNYSDSLEKRSDWATSSP